MNDTLFGHIPKIWKFSLPPIELFCCSCRLPALFLVFSRAILSAGSLKRRLTFIQEKDFIKSEDNNLETKLPFPVSDEFVVCGGSLVLALLFELLSLF